MFAAMLFAISTVALAQFALYYWRAVLTGVASQPVSPSVLEAARVKNGALTASDFQTLAELHDLTPQLNASKTGGLGLVRVYFHVIQALDTVFGSFVPAISNWSQRECALCARYAAVQIDRRLQANLQLAASLRSC
jgi:hypothetical protein